MQENFSIETFLQYREKGRKNLEKYYLPLFKQALHVGIAVVSYVFFLDLIGLFGFLLFALTTARIDYSWQEDESTDGKQMPSGL